MSLTVIIFLILLGIILFYVEFLVLPGLSVAGIAGAVVIILGIYFAYKDFGTMTGHYFLIGTAIVLVISIVLMLRSNTWEKIALNSKIEGKSGGSIEEGVLVGDQGETVTRLAPYGKVKVGDKFYEAKSEGSIINPKVKIEVKKIDRSYLIVKPKN